MSTLLVLLLLAGLAYAIHCRRGPGPGASADARARQLRTLPVRIAELLGIRTIAGQQARRYAAGAAGERSIAAALRHLTRRGWTLLYDRALPRGRANLDCLAISPAGAVAVVDAKKWAARYPVTVAGGSLLHGRTNVTARLAGLRHEAAVVAEQLGVAVSAVVVLDGPALHDAGGGEVAFTVLGDITITTRRHAAYVLTRLLNPPHIPRPRDSAARRLATAAGRQFPPYTARRRTR